MATARTARCSDCGSTDTELRRYVNTARQPGPGERAMFECNDCGNEFFAIEPEPSDGYEGDGVFAPNH